MEAIKRAVTALLKTINKTVDASADGKFTLAEDVAIGISVIGWAPTLKHLPEIREELKLIVPERDIPILVEEIKKDLDFKDDALEEKIEAAFNTIAQFAIAVFGKQ